MTIEVHESSPVASLSVILFRKGITKAMFRLRGRRLVCDVVIRIQNTTTTSHNMVSICTFTIYELAFEGLVYLQASIKIPQLSSQTPVSDVGH